MINEALSLSGNDIKFKEYFHIISKDESVKLFQSIKELLNLGGKIYSWKSYEDQQQELKDLSLNQEDSHNHFNAGIGNSSLADIPKIDNGNSSLSLNVNLELNKKNIHRTMYVERPNLEDPNPKSSPSKYLET